MVHRIFFALTVIGVILLVGISVLSVISITGRALSDLGLRPVQEISSWSKRDRLWQCSVFCPCATCCGAMPM